MSAPSAVIMGGSSGIGRASASEFLDTGHSVLITGRDADRLESAVMELRDAHQTADVRAHQVDARDPDQLRQLFGGLDCISHLVLALSGASGAGAIRELDLYDLRAGFEAKTLPYVACLQFALPKMSNDGSVTLVTAGSAQSALPGTAGLAAINRALEAMVRPLALELAPIRANAVSPGVIDTPRWARCRPSAAQRCIAQQPTPARWAESEKHTKWRASSSP